MMKSYDIIILLKKTTPKGQNLSCRGLAESLGISVSSVSEGLERCKKAQLLDRNKKRVNALALLEFLSHGIMYVFPVETGRMIRGIPTYISAAPMSDRITNNGETFVWKYAKGTVRGQQIEPLYASVPEAVQKDDDLYQLLAIVDTFRVGSAREREIAVEELTKRIMCYAENK